MSVHQDSRWTIYLCSECGWERLRLSGVGCVSCLADSLAFKSVALAPAEITDRLAGSLMTIEREAGEKWVRDEARSALARYHQTEEERD
jgi:hypothetical protein